MTLFDEPDVALLFLILILWVVGQKIVEGNLKLRQWGMRISAGSFVAYCLYGIFFFRPESSSEYLWIAVRAVLFSGVALGTSWIALGCSWFIYQMINPIRLLQRISRQTVVEQKPSVEVQREPVVEPIEEREKDIGAVVQDLLQERRKAERIIREYADDEDMREAMEAYQRRKFHERLGKLLDEDADGEGS